MSNETNIDSIMIEKLVDTLLQETDILPIAGIADILLNDEKNESEKSKKSRQLRYYIDELNDSDQPDLLPYKPQTIIEQLRFIVIVYQLLNDLTLAQLKKKLTDEGFKQQFKNAILAPDSMETMASVIVLEKGKIEQAELYNYIAPRLAEIIFHIVFNDVPERALLVINLDEDIHREIPHNIFVAYVSEIGSIITSVKKHHYIPEDYEILMSMLDGRLKILFPKDLPYILRKQPDNSLYGTYNLLNVGETYAQWLYNLVKVRQENGIYTNNTAMVRNNKELRLHRLNLALEWLIQQARQTGKKWSFAVALCPQKIVFPRYLAKLQVVACSENAPYRGYLPFESIPEFDSNPNQTKNKGTEFYSNRAFNLGQIIVTGTGKRGFIKPEKFEDTVDSAICVPTVSESNINSILYVASTENDCQFTEDDELILALFGQITGEMLSTNLNHRDSNVLNFRQILDNHIIISPIFSGFSSSRRCRQDLNALWKELPHNYKFIFIVIDVNQSRDIVEANIRHLTSQYDIDDFFKSLGADIFPRFLNKHLPIPSNIVHNKIFDKISGRIYQLTMDRFAFIVPFLDNYDKNEIKRNLIEVVKDIYTQTLSNYEKGISVKIIADIIQTNQNQSFDTYRSLNERFIFAEIDYEMNLLAKDWRNWEEREKKINKTDTEMSMKERIRVVEGILETMVIIL